MSTKIFAKPGISLFICFSMLVAQGAQAGSGGSASSGDIRVKCGSGLLPLAMDGDLKGVVDTPSAQVSLSGGHVQFGYCGYLVPGKGPSLASANGQSVAGDQISSIDGPNGLHISCRNGELPFVLRGSAEGALVTSKGAVSLHGDQNEVAVCLTPAKSTD